MSAGQSVQLRSLPIKARRQHVEAHLVFDVETALRELVRTGGSDLHLRAYTQPRLRVSGELLPLEGSEALTPADTEGAVRHMLRDQAKLEEFNTDHEVDFSFALSGVARFRVNAFQQRGTVAIVIRAIPFDIRTLDELNLPGVMRDIADEERGIILVTGTTGSGKSTTLASIIDHINRTYPKHVVTIEDPIEFLHKDHTALINQREVGMDTLSFKRALRRVLRQDPDVILIGEMRDEETVQTALSAAETGHLVLSTLHTVDATETINRIIDFFPPHMHQQARAMVAGTLKAIISQRLVKTVDGGRAATCEILRMTGRVRDMILDPEQTGKLPEVIAEGSYYGMQTFDQALYAHVKAGRVSTEVAMKAASSPHDFKLLLAAEGRRGTTMDDVGEAEIERGDAEAAPAVAPAPALAPAPAQAPFQAPAPPAPL
ncbi:MAG: type IV pilus twitching motility protein PilT, partial [Solirubrobacteraceae bacterium]|nr:type IV pilus twitching motility protein PilT [Solirubrobacteraceae bacterium]